MFDSLTGLYRRAYVVERAALLLNSSHTSVLFINLDDFRRVNETAGYASGDRVLRAVAHRLAGAARSGDLIARSGSDEFLILMDCYEERELARCAARIIGLIGAPFMIDGRELTVGASVGIARRSDGKPDTATLVRNAEMAMRAAKRLGRNCTQFFTQAIDGEMERRAKIQSALPGALAGGELALAWQPVVDGASGKTVCAEALLRWTHDELGAVSPMQFVPIAERNGLIGSIGDWVLEQACTQAQQWRRSVAPDLGIAVNISPLQLDKRFVRKISRVLELSGIHPSALELEITEGRQVLDTPSVMSSMAAIAGFGVKFVIDDFGTGYSSLSYLRRLQVHGLKIDRSFVAGLPHESRSVAIVEGLEKIAHSMGLTVTAEGIETNEQAAFLRECGIDRMQGFLFSHPLKPDDFINGYGRRGS
ncbi:bifunctional diguanylate cyclase/phosphodiesterase [Paraburkholderia sp. LEh10]|uniref:putative bifunctional diguanylate cyclase/phosphodiesterase n=1 Tax=Paraburkholderia sp. LEh10 TaxID=2821353 RepID=UPI001AE1216A|nr:bifunctional diguanylate cyclase/phosphodiesterase [Paraburkholderia sp. LEh10]MBP0595605.1 bifunctional diguanylate cyclase/phosphodiesterase [Paraburkholderia sp. LEh10]